MADFNPEVTSMKWYNILSLKVIENECLSIAGGTQNSEKQQREESSDESTIISSQTSTLTRNQGKFNYRIFNLGSNQGVIY